MDVLNEKTPSVEPLDIAVPPTPVSVLHILRVEFDGRGVKFRIFWPQGVRWVDLFEQFVVMAERCKRQSAANIMSFQAAVGGESVVATFEFRDLSVPEVDVTDTGLSRGQWELLAAYFDSLAQATIKAMWQQNFAQQMQAGPKLVKAIQLPGHPGNGKKMR